MTGASRDLKLIITSFLFARWIQIARRIISKSRRGDVPSAPSGSQPNHSKPLPGLPARTFNGSENDLRLNYNSSMGTGQYGMVGQYGASSGQYGIASGQYGITSGQYGMPAVASTGQYQYRLPSTSLYGGGRDGIRFSPDGGGRTSPEGVQVYKTRVIYHSKQDRPAADHLSSV